MKTPWELFGVECNKGWERIVLPLLERAQAEGVEVLQVKEKFGGLRFYVGPASEAFHAAIRLAEEESYRTCEVCGEPGALRVDGWMQTLCDAHATNADGTLRPTRREKDEP